jgi:hypothetical protein
MTAALLRMPVITWELLREETMLAHALQEARLRSRLVGKRSEMRLGAPGVHQL